MVGRVDDAQCNCLRSLRLIEGDKLYNRLKLQ